jgi:hypothetical protein
MCEDSAIKESISPDGRMKVVVLERNCGATTPYATLVSIIKADSARSKLFESIAVLNRRESLFAKEISLSWADDQHLKITYPTTRENLLKT